jgi:hypothetical protein
LTTIYVSGAGDPSTMGLVAMIPICAYVIAILLRTQRMFTARDAARQRSAP